jgi:hypothetical protein
MNGHWQNIVDLLWSEIRRSVGVPPAELVGEDADPTKELLSRVPGQGIHIL